MLEIHLEVLKGETAAAAESFGLRKAMKKNWASSDDVERVWSPQLPGDTVKKLSAG